MTTIFTLAGLAAMPGLLCSVLQEPISARAQGQCGPVLPPPHLLLLPAQARALGTREVNGSPRQWTGREIA
jgi:hypothetical protein